MNGNSQSAGTRSTTSPCWAVVISANSIERIVPAGVRSMIGSSGDSCNASVPSIEATVARFFVPVRVHERRFGVEPLAVG